MNLHHSVKFSEAKKEKNEVRDLSQKSNRIWMNNKHLSLKFQKNFEASKDGVHRYLLNYENQERIALSDVQQHLETIEISSIQTNNMLLICAE